MTGREPVRRCVCPGSFDPVHVGHVDIVLRAADLFDEVVVAVMGNPAKAGLFTVAERAGLLRQALGDADRVRVQAVEGRLLVDFCAEVGAVAVVKGVRTGDDLSYETPMALMNRHLSGVETLFLPADPAHAHLSSSLIKEVVGLGGDVSGMVPGPVREALAARLGQ